MSVLTVVLAALVGISAPPRLTHGPFLGDVTPESARVWCRAGAPGPYRLTVTDRVGRVVASDRKEATADAHSCITFEVGGLQPGGRYEYHVMSLLDGEQETKDVLASHGFTTAPLPDAPGVVRLAFGSCCNDAKFKEQPVWGVIAGEAVDAVLLIGDTPYIDTTDLAKQRRRYGEFFSVPGIRELLCSTPLYSTWDDHDFGINDTDGRIKGKENSRRAFIEYHANPSDGEEGEGVYTKFRRGPVEVFLIDARWFSGTEPSFADPEQPTLLGARQWEWLKKGLVESTAPFKILTTGMIWNDSVRARKSDYWGAYPHEREAVLKFIGENRIGGVVLMGGDIHRSRALKHSASDGLGALVGYDLLELIASPLANDVHANSKVPHPAVIAEGESQHSVVIVEVDTRPETGPGGRLVARCLDAAGGAPVELFRVEVAGSSIGVK